LVFSLARDIPLEPFEVCGHFFAGFAPDGERDEHPANAVL
jgi:hypothetical protein